MSQLRQVADPLRRFSFCYGSTDRSENKHIVPTISSVLAYREQFKQPENSSQHLKRAASMKQQHMEVFASRWAHETGSMIYVVVKTGSNYAIGSPLCVETGLYKEYEHLRSVSFNSSSKDVKNLKLRDRQHQPFSFASSLVIGDLVVVLKTGFVEHIERKTNQPSGRKLHVALEYYVLDRNYESGVALAVRTTKGFEIYKSFGDLSLPPCTIAESVLRDLLNTPSILPEEYECMATPAPPKQVTHLPNVFLMYAEMFMPHRKCYRSALNFKSTASHANELLTDVAKLITDDVKNYMPYKPVPLIACCSLLNSLHDCFSSREGFVTLNALKALRSAKLQSGVSNFQDCRFIDTTVAGWDITEGGAETAETLSTYQLLPFNQALKRNSTHEERVFYQAFLNKNIMVHLHESPVGSGKTTVLAAAVKARLIVDQHSRIALTAMTNSAVIALLTAFEFPLDYCDEKLRPLVVQAKNWKHVNGVSSHFFDWKIVMKNCFIEELVKFDIHKPVSDESRYSKIKSMLSYVRNNSIIALSRKLGQEKYDFISKLICPMLNKQELVNHFFHLYKPNLIIATMDSLVNFTSFLPVDHMPNLIAIDECTMIQPSDLCLFSSKMQSMSFESIEFVLIGDHKQLTPFNGIQSLSPLTVTPNVLLMNNAAFTTRFTVVHRCHNNATELVSSVFYGGYLTSGKDPNQSYIQHRLKGVPFRNPKVKAYSFVGNNSASCAVAQSRCNIAEASAIAEYAQKLIDVDHINPSQISVITPFLAQAELLQKVVPGGITCSTSRKYQGLENDIVLFSCCHTGGKQGSIVSEDEMYSEGFRVQTSNTGTVKCKLIDDDAIILVSLTRSRHFTTIFGNETFLRTIPRWNAILNGILQ
ncbi:hypothetical protein GCK72_012560 [Caenorhabditis remanei]|uniref:DNA2/NAM7 helicase-like C-terminal domain-containing protein n=1 Tax=Caenorhabditis remanei TaxID=31234 RepID=E3NNA9_CAERE|nr:hypothetical protein GCK72_012560 [Caenorhabditis remanei]EFP10489.1 hypothetical protein CRE_15069 [Caenorhabditis remanei]KAF1756107.1 hypothetical protein GCK72_012560 [Caenorhabditis remanei]